MTGRYWVETLGCPKNQVDSDKLAGTLAADGLAPARDPGDADLIVVNTCAFIEAARQESVDTVLALSGARREGARLVVTGCLAERYGSELADALPEVDLVAGFGVPVSLVNKPAGSRFDLLNLPRPPAQAPWAYVKVAEGCDRTCGFCAIPSFRGPQRSRSFDAILAEVEALGAAEVVLVAQDLASYGRDDGRRGDIVPLVRAVAARVPRTRLLYLYPSELIDGLIEAMGETGCPYFDLSLQHVSKAHLRRMRRWGDGSRFLARIGAIRARQPEAAFRSSFIVGYPGETESDHDELLRFLEDAQLDWAGFFSFSREEGTYAAGRADQVDPTLVAERMLECGELQDGVTAGRRAALIGTTTTVLVDRPGVGRSHREAPEIDGVIRLAPSSIPGVTGDGAGTSLPGDPAGASLPCDPAGRFVEVEITGAEGPDLEARPLPATATTRRH
jgi:ribosomal protein S12 methylthiotransferase